jgi:hypothetical protein
MPTMNFARGAALRRPLAVAAVAAGLTLAGCGTNAGNAPATSSNAPSGPAVNSTAPAQAQPATIAWAKSMCQALGPAFSQLGAPPQPDTANPAATRQAYVDYLSRASNAAQQAYDRLASVGPPPVQNGQQILDQARTQLSQLRDNLNNALTQLKAASSNESAAIGPAFSAAGNAVSLVGTLTDNPQLRAAIDQTPECQSVPGVSGTSSTTTPGQPPR